MYLHEIRIKNFRKYGNPGLTLEFNKGLNVLIGENDSGKTCIVDAIRMVLGTQGREFFRLEKEDFHKDTNSLEIECVFKGFNNNEAKDFLEWLSIDEEKKFYLRVVYRAKQDIKRRILVEDLTAGADEQGITMNRVARELLRTTYLRPLRDAENELAAKKSSRFAQILYAHPEFGKGDEHPLVEIFDEANNKITDYFKYTEDDEEDKVLKSINTFLKCFSVKDDPLKSHIHIAQNRLRNILEKLDLKLIDTKPGLGSLNQLYIATELLLLSNHSDEGVKLALIEEIEAHLHPQAQLRVIKYLEKLSNDAENQMQTILTTHSIALASSIQLSNLIVVAESKAFPLKSGKTRLKDTDYRFLERFLDATKANLFFAKGVLLVEGDAENILLPTLARMMDRDLTEYGVSIINVGSTALLRYANIFVRTDQNQMRTPIAVITDCDIAVYKYNKPNIELQITDQEENAQRVEEKVNTLKDKYNADNVSVFIAKQWTLEFELACSCIKKELYAAILMAEDYEKLDKERDIEIRTIEEYLAEATTSVDGWEMAYSTWEVAREITQKVVIKKYISKAIVAQCLAQIIEKQNYQDQKIQEIKDDIYLKYLIDAFEYVTSGGRDGDASNNQ